MTPYDAATPGNVVLYFEADVRKREAEAAAHERQRIRRDLIDGDPGQLEAAFRAVLDDEKAAECAGIVATLLDGVS